MTHSIASRTAGSRNGVVAGDVHAMPRAALALALIAAAAVFSTVAIAKAPLLDWLEGQYGSPPVAQVPELQAADADEAAPPQRETRSRARTRCASCGVVSAIRRIEPAGDMPAAYEFTVRLRDGSTRTSSTSSPSKWSVGDPIILIGGDTAFRK